jgi:DNA invertase Pin-like site-specific DNA recombinase
LWPRWQSFSSEPSSQRTTEQTMSPKITVEHLGRQAVVYVRQSTQGQIHHHPESRRRQYGLVETARELGFRKVETIDEDLGRSGGGYAERPGFQRLLSLVCSTQVGAVLALEASRLARNDRDWSHLVELCALAKVVLIDHDGVYDPRTVNDRLLLGLKGIMSEFEMSTLRMRANEAKRHKAARGELRILLPVGYVYAANGPAIELDPDKRIQQAIHLVFGKFRELGAIRQVLLWFRRERVQLPAASTSRSGGTILWEVPKYSRVHEILTNPVYAGAYVYGRTGYRTLIAGGHIRRTSGHKKALQDWEVLIRNHHAGYIDWEQYLSNAARIEENAYVNSSGRKSARGGRSLLAGLLRCRRCGHKLSISYTGPQGTSPYFRCMRRHNAQGADFCISFTSKRFDDAVGAEVLRVAETKSIEAAIEAAKQADTTLLARRQALVLELEEARYQARLAERRYEQVDPEQRLVAAELEARWNAALLRVSDIEHRLESFEANTSRKKRVDRDRLLAVATDLPALWNDPATDMRLKQRVVRILIQEILVDVDEPKNVVRFVIHWSGGRHSELEVEKNRSGRTNQRTSGDAIALIRQMAGRCNDQAIAAALNRIGCRTAKNKTWNAANVRELRGRLQLPAYDPSHLDQSLLTCQQAAARLGLSPQYVGQLLARGIIRGERVAPGAPWSIPAAVIASPELRATLDALSRRRPPSLRHENRNLTIPGL